MKRRVLLFAKRPRLGKVKTRLVPPLDPDQALGLYRAFLIDQVSFVRSLTLPALEIELCADGAWDPAPALDPPLERVRLTEQGPGDLGRRMLHAFRRARDEGAGSAVILAVDAPTLPEGRVRDAFARLGEGADAVLAPADDGGYVLLGMSKPHPELFRDVPWDSERVLEVTRRRADRAGLSLAELEPWYDVDDATGLRALRRELAAEPAAVRAPATARFLSGLTRQLDA